MVATAKGLRNGQGSSGKGEAGEISESFKAVVFHSDKLVGFLIDPSKAVPSAACTYSHTQWAVFIDAPHFDLISRVDGPPTNFMEV